jgi:HlyD family secretion protein
MPTGTPIDHMSTPNTTSPRVGTRDVEAALGIGAGRHLSAAPAARWLLLALAASAAIGATAYWWLGGPQPGISYVTAPAARGMLTVTVTATGYAQPTNKIDISTELSGTVHSVLVDYNTPVAAGQVLAELDTERLEATVAMSRARLIAARARVNEADATIEERAGEYERQQALFERGAVSTQDLALARAAYDRAVAALASARADVQLAQAELAVNETDLSKACICSPIDGIVLERNVDPGQTVAASFQAPVLFTIAEDLTQMELQVDVDEADVGSTRAGQQATFTVDAYPGRRFPAEVRDIRYAPETVQGVVTYKALLTIDNSEQLLRPGMTATAEIVVQELKDALLVPNAALRFSPPSDQDAAPAGSFFQRLMPGPPRSRPATRPAEKDSEREIWVLREGVAVAVPVVVGASDGRSTEIVRGDLSDAEQVIVDSSTASR